MVLKASNSLHEMSMLNFHTMVKNALTPFVITDEKNVVVAYNDYANDWLGKKLKKGIAINDIFQIWKKQNESDVILAEIDEECFYFLRSILNDSNHTLFIGIEDNFFNDLVSENDRLKNINRDLSAAIDNSYDGIYITDHQGITLKTNAAIERLTGIPKEYYIGKNVDSLISRGILKESVTHRVVKQRRTVSIVEKNFEGKEILLTGTPLFNENGEVEKIVTNIRDLSDLNELQAEIRKVRKQNEAYRKELSKLKKEKHVIQGAIVNNDQMKEIYETAERIANIDVTILITGETGVGKDVLAKYIYEKSERSKKGEYIKVNCGAIPADLLESELFGYEAGAFTGANPKGKVGLFEAANDGVLFLDEIGELPLNLQVKLLRVLQEGEIQRIGGVKTKKVDTRIIAATNRDLMSMVKKGEFREDLYYRLNVIPLDIPPLRKRRDDILPLTDFFLNEVNEKYKMQKVFSNDLKKYFYSYDWPGNVRELANLVERLVVTTLGDEIRADDLPEKYVENDKNPDQLHSIRPLKEAVELAEKRVLSLAIEQCNSTYEVARLLEVSQPTVVRRLKKYGIDFR